MNEGRRVEQQRALDHFLGKLEDVACTDTVDMWRGVVEQQIAGARDKLDKLEQERQAVVMAIEIAKRYRSTVKLEQTEPQFNPLGGLGMFRRFPTG